MLSTDLNIGEISATFSSTGKIPFEMHELKISVNLGAHTSTFSLRMLMLIPVDDFLGSS